MPFKMVTKCSRCGKDKEATVDSLEAAQSFDALEAKRTARMKEILEFFANIPPEEYPALMVVGSGGKDGSGFVHLNLCDEGKRSCKKTIAGLLKNAGEQEPREKKERKPRKKKDEAAAAPAIAAVK